MKKLVSIVVSLALMLQILPASLAVVSAVTGKNSLTATRGVYWFSPHEVDEDLVNTYIYDDELLKGDSLKFNSALATMSYELAVVSISSSREERTPKGYANKSRNLKAYLEDNGFIDFDTNKDYKEKMTIDSMGTACAHKKIVDGGKTYTVLAIVPRSAGYEAEWGGNFILNDTEDDNGDAAGFKHAKEKVLNYAKEYISKYKIKGDIKVWLPGYSRGAGVTNQVGAALLNRPKEVLGTAVTLKPGNLYCYTFGTPNSASVSNGTEGSYNDSKFNYIHNVLEPYDVITIAPPSGLGFGRYGTVTGYASKEKKQRMLEFLKITNDVLYDVYMSVGDPDNFAPKTLDIDALIEDQELKLKNDDNSYLPDNQPAFMALLEKTVEKAMGDNRQYYYTNHVQDGMSHFAAFYQTHMGSTSKLIQSVQKNKYTIPMLMFMYISYMVERYKDTNFDQTTINQVEKAISLLREIIQELQSEGETVPEDIITNLNELQSILSTANTWDKAVVGTRMITGALYSEVIDDAMKSIGYNQEDPGLYEKIKSRNECNAMSRAIAYILLYNENQTEKIISFDTVTQQFKQMATIVGNAGSFRRPHTNEVILSWLRANDSAYDDVKKTTTAQDSGYRRLYIKQPAGVTVTGTVKDANGKVVAKFKNGKITSRTDKWIGITTSDNGNWLRLPVDKTYKVDLKVNKNTKLDLKAVEYDVESAKLVRTVKKDANYNWTGLKVKKTDKVTWVISKVASKGYKLPSSAKYYINLTHAKKNILVAKGISKGSTKIKISWNKIKGAEKYVIYFSKCNKDGVERIPKKVKTVSAKKLSWTKSGLKKATIYKYYVAAQKKVDGKYKNICNSKQGHTITGNVQGNRANPKSMKLNKSKLTLKKGKTGTIKATVKPIVKGKSIIRHTPKIRYTSDCPDVATVSAKGKVKAVSIGTAKIYVQTENGMWKTVKVTVK